MMKTRTIIATVSSYLFCISVAAQTPPVDPVPRTLEQTLRHALAERVPMPLAFSTRDTAFVLSLPKDEPAEIYLRLTLTRNGKVREKLTRVDANHIAAYVAPAFVAATKELRVDPALCARMAGKDTALLLAFPLEYQCVLDTMSKAWPNEHPYTIPFLPRDARMHLSYEQYQWENSTSNNHRIRNDYNELHSQYLRSNPTRIRYYVVFPAKQPE